jgi:hypothetical protein
VTHRALRRIVRADDRPEADPQRVVAKAGGHGLLGTAPSAGPSLRPSTRSVSVSSMRPSALRSSLARVKSAQTETLEMST